MEAERWQQIERLFHAALERAPDERAALLAEACAGDERLQHEVESLLAEQARDGGLLEAGAAGELAAAWLQELWMGLCRCAGIRPTAPRGGSNGGCSR